MKGFVDVGCHRHYARNARSARSRPTTSSRRRLRRIPFAAPSAYDWTGFYAGGHVAYGFGRATSTLSNPNPTVVGNPFGSQYGGLQGGYNYVFPSRLLLGAEADITFPYFFENGTIFTGGRPKARPSPTRSMILGPCAAVSAMRWIVGSFTEPAASPGRWRVSVKLPASPAMKTRFAHAHRLGARPRRRACVCAELDGADGISLRRLRQPPPRSSRRAPVTGQHSTSKRCGWGSTASSAHRIPKLQRTQPANRGRSRPITGMSTASSPSSSRAIPRSIRRTKVQTALPVKAKPKIR